MTLGVVSLTACLRARLCNRAVGVRIYVKTRPLILAVTGGAFGRRLFL